MRVGRSEAVDLLRKWRSEEALLRCDMSFPRFAALFRARVFLVDEVAIRLLSDDMTSEMTFRFSDDVDLEYVEPRGFPEDTAFFDSSLVMRFDDGDFISLTVIIER